MLQRTPIKRYTPLRAKNPWRPKRKRIKIGRVGRANSAARKEISKMAEQMNLKICEIDLPGCSRTWPLAPAHRHKRAWYKGDAKLLARRDQWVCGCQGCHDKIEIDPELTEDVFKRLRGPEPVALEKLKINY